MDNNKTIAIKKELENEINEVNEKISNYLKNTNIKCSLEELENIFYINDISYFSSVAFDVVNHQYQFGDDYSMYDEPNSIEEKRMYDEAIKNVNKELIAYFNDNYPLLQIKISKIYIKDFFNIKYKYDPTIIRCYLYNINNEFNYKELDYIWEYYIVNDILNRRADLIINDYIVFWNNNYYCMDVKDGIDDFIENKVRNLFSNIKNKISKDSYDNIVFSYNNLNEDDLIF